LKNNRICPPNDEYISPEYTDAIKTGGGAKKLKKLDLKGNGITLASGDVFGWIFFSCLDEIAVVASEAVVVAVIVVVVTVVGIVVVAAVDLL